VIVVWIFGVGRNVVAILTLEVGNSGLLFFLVIAVGGTGCIGANLVRPVCIVYATPKSPCAGFAGAAPLLVASTRAGPSVPVTDFIPSSTVCGNTPVMPEREKRGE
jgi:hypothetical protein